MIASASATIAISSQATTVLIPGLHPARARSQHRSSRKTHAHSLLPLSELPVLACPARTTALCEKGAGQLYLTVTNRRQGCVAERGGLPAALIPAAPGDRPLGAACCDWRRALRRINVSWGRCLGSWWSFQTRCSLSAPPTFSCSLLLWTR